MALRPNFTAYPLFSRVTGQPFQPGTREFAWLIAHSQGPVASAEAQAAKMRVAKPYGQKDLIKWYIYFSTDYNIFSLIVNHLFTDNVVNNDFTTFMQDEIRENKNYWDKEARSATIALASAGPGNMRGPSPTMVNAPALAPSSPIESANPSMENRGLQNSLPQWNMNDDCPICSSPLTGKANMDDEGNGGRGDGTRILMVPCGHMMHRICYNDYVTNPHTTSVQRNKCPICSVQKTRAAIVNYRQPPIGGFRHTMRKSVTRGWRKQSPGKHQRTTMRKSCGKKCFLGAKGSFPICKKRTCKVDKRGVYAAFIRARQWGHSAIAKKAKKILRSMRRLTHKRR